MSSIRENILANVVSTLDNIATADGYNYNISSSQIHRTLKMWEECNSFPQLFVNLGSESKDDLGLNTITSTVELIVRGYEHDADDASEKVNNLLQDIEKVLLVDPTRGGYAIDTRPKSIDTDEGWLRPYGIFEFRFEVIYNYEYGSP